MLTSMELFTWIITFTMLAILLFVWSAKDDDDNNDNLT